MTTWQQYANHAKHARHAEDVDAANAANILLQMRSNKRRVAEQGGTLKRTRAITDKENGTDLDAAALYLRNKPDYKELHDLVRSLIIAHSPREPQTPRGLPKQRSESPDSRNTELQSLGSATPRDIDSPNKESKILIAQIERFLHEYEAGTATQLLKDFVYKAGRNELTYQPPTPTRPSLQFRG